MERMTIAVKKVTSNAVEKVVTGAVVATSGRKLGGEPVVAMMLVVRVRLKKSESVDETEERIREEAYRFLDIA